MVSVVIPVYNVKDYLTRCVHSVINQTYKDLEIILVDDGSTDGCSTICDNLMTQDNRIVTIHKTNGGLSDARNVGTSAANGDFVFYLDSDDFIDENAIEELVKCQKKSNCELVISNYFYTYEDHEDVAKFEFNDNEILDRTEAMEALVTGKIQNFAWGKLINREIALNCKFPNNKLFEDVYWTHNVIHKTDKVALLSIPTVHYYQRNSSISYSFTIRSLDILEGWTERLNFINENYPNIKFGYLKTLALQYLQIVWIAVTKLKTDRKTAIDKLRKFNAKTKLQNYTFAKNKKLIILFDKSVFIYLIFAIFCKIIGR